MAIRTDIAFALSLPVHPHGNGMLGAATMPLLGIAQNKTLSAIALTKNRLAYLKNYTSEPQRLWLTFHCGTVGELRSTGLLDVIVQTMKTQFMNRSSKS